MRQFSAGNQWLSAGGKAAFGGQAAPSPSWRGLSRCGKSKSWMPGTSPGMTKQRLNRGSPLLEVQPSHEIPLAERNAVGAQDVVGGGGVEIEIGQRERHQKALRREGQLVLTEMEYDVLAAEPVDSLQRQRRQRFLGISDQPLQPGIIIRRLERRRLENGLLHA